MQEVIRKNVLEGISLINRRHKSIDMKQRKIDRITSNPPHPGFLGEGHTASAVIDGTDFKKTDPFILLMDDRLNLPGGPPVGGAHPHAGFETVTFILLTQIV